MIALEEIEVGDKFVFNDKVFVKTLDGGYFVGLLNIVCLEDCYRCHLNPLTMVELIQ